MSKCIKCGHEAYFSFNTVECSNVHCEDFSIEYSEEIGGWAARAKKASRTIKHGKQTASIPGAELFALPPGTRCDGDTLCKFSYSWKTNASKDWQNKSTFRFATDFGAVEGPILTCAPSHDLVGIYFPTGMYLQWCDYMTLRMKK